MLLNSAAHVLAWPSGNGTLHRVASMTTQGPPARCFSRLTDNLSHATCRDTAQRQLDLEGPNALFRCSSDTSRLCMYARICSAANSPAQSETALSGRPGGRHLCCPLDSKLAVREGKLCLEVQSDSQHLMSRRTQSSNIDTDKQAANSSNKGKAHVWWTRAGLLVQLETSSSFRKG